MKWVTIVELMSVNTLPSTVQGINQKAKRENWIRRRKPNAEGNVYEYLITSLPLEVQRALAEREALTLAESTLAEAKAAREQRVAADKQVAKRMSALTDKQRETVEARLLVVDYIKALLKSGDKRRVTLERVSRESREGRLPENIAQALPKALARNTGNGIGVRTLNEWLCQSERCQGLVQTTLTFAPVGCGRSKKSLSQYFWLPDFLECYQVFTGIPLAEAYRNFALRFAGLYPHQSLPSEHLVRQVMRKIPPLVRERGRKGQSALRAMATYTKRDWSVLHNNDVWVGDGHSLKMKVAHPEHGQPFTPELTLIMDAASRYIVGWSLAYSENTFAVADALRNAMINHGIPALYYSDNGAGQTSKILDADLTGILHRLGIDHQTGIPGNPQGRGIIERVMQTLAYPIARRFQTYYGTGADRDAVRQISQATVSLSKAIAEKRTELTLKQQSALGKLPKWRELLTVIQESVDNYNHHHQHSELKCTPFQRREELKALYPDDDVVMLSEWEAKELFRPAFKRKVQRGWLTLFNQHYWHNHLEALNEQEVLMLVDQHDPRTVIVRDLDGRYLCEAQLNGNTAPAFAQSLIEQSRQKRAERKLQRLEDEARKAKAELRPAIELQAQEDLSALVGDLDWQTFNPVKEEAEILLFASDQQP
ncbi:MAG: Mu transposase C-terminal domain-containing protein [Cardiobacteriaceae bacterium]|nr:Mu transposase C-terminal domain-containing protein [Cardiobacteriaceae bacterium]